MPMSNGAPIHVRLADSGWFFECNGRSVGPFAYLNDVDEAEVAEKLGVAPKQVFLAKLKLQSRLSRPLIEPKNSKTGPLRDAVKFNFIAPFYSKPRMIYDEEGLLRDVTVEFRLYRAVQEAKQPPLIIYDIEGYINPKIQEYSLAKVDSLDVTKIITATPYSLWSKLLRQHNLENENDEEHPVERLWRAGVLVKPVPRLRNVDFLSEMDWRKFVNEIVDFKGIEIDWRLKLVRLTHLMRGLKQAVNPHALIVLPGQTGKSEWYKHVGICEDKVSANSLIGYADADGPRPGSVDGSILPFALDQIESSGMYTIFRYMLGLMEFGEARVDMAAFPFTIHSSSVFSILSNPLGEVKSNFAVLLEKLSKNPALGRRFGIILYDKDAVRIKRREKDMDALKEKVALFRAVEEYCLSELKKILSDERVWAWLNTRNEEFVKQSLQLIEPIEKENESLYLFLKEFVENGGSHTRGGALRASLTLNLDKIALKEYTVEELLTEAEEILTDLLKINFDSLKLIAATFQETKEQSDLRAFDMLPVYIKEIVSAVELWRRSLSENDKTELKVPLSFYLNTIDYRPQSAEYFSQIILNARKANPEKYNEILKEHFQFELKKEDKDLRVWVYSLAAIPHLKVLGNLGNLGNLVSFWETVSSKNNIDEEHSSLGKEASSNVTKIPKIPKIPKNSEKVKPSVKEVLEKLRGVFVEGTEEEFLASAVDAGLSRGEAQSLFESLKGEELFWFDRDGKTFWRWVHG